MTSNAEFRAAFRKFIGNERYIKFLSQGRRGRWLFWQDEALAQFFESHPGYRMPEPQLIEALRVCEVHGTELQLGQAEVFKGCIDYSPTFLDERRRNFPHACLEPVSTEGLPVSEIDLSVWYCADCRVVQRNR